MGQETFLRVGVDGTGAQAGARVVTRSMDDISNSAQTVGKHVAYLQSALTHLAGTAIGVYGIATALQAIKSVSLGVLDYLGKIETATLGIASAFLVSGTYQDTITKKALQGQTALKAAQNESVGIIEQLKVANFQTIATLDQLIFAYQVTLPVAMSAGFNKKQVMEYTLAMVQAAGAIGLSFDQIAEETRSMLTGNITRNSRIAQVLGLTNSDVSALKGNASGLFDMLMNRLSGFRVAGIEAQKTWAGLLSNTKDIALQLAGKSFDPVFETVKAKLMEVQKAVFTISKDSNGIQAIKFSDEFLQQAASASEFLKKFIDVLISSVSFIYNHAGAIKALVEIYIGFRLTTLAASTAQKIANALSIESFAIENARRAMATEMLSVSAQQAQASAASTAAEVAKYTAIKNGLQASIEAQSVTVADIAYQKQSAASKLQDIELEQVKIAARRVALQNHLEVIAVETATIQEKYGISKEILLKEVVDVQSSTSSMNMTWRQFLGERMADYMKMEGSHSAAMKRMSAEWAVYKANALAAVEQVAVASVASSSHTVSPVQMSKQDASFAKELRNAEWNSRNALITIMNEEEMINARLQAAQAKELALSEQLRNAKYKLNLANTELMGTESRLVAATVANTAAQSTSTVATDLHAAALAAQGIGARLAAGAMSTLNTAMSYLGGPIGTIITLLGVAATAWVVFGRDAKKANEDALKGSDDVLESLRKQNKELLERKRIQRASTADSKDGKLSDGIFTDKEFEQLKKLEAQKAEIEKTLSKMPNFSMKEVDTRRITSSAQNTVSALKMSLSQITSQIDEMRRLKAANVAMEKETEYKPNDPKKVQDDSLKNVRAAREALNHYIDAQDARALASIKNQTKLEENALSSRHSLQLVSEQDFINKKFQLEETGIQKELDQIRRRELKAKSDVQEAEARLGTGKAKPGKSAGDANLELLADYRKTLTELEKAEMKREGLESAFALARQKRGEESLQNIKAQIKAFSDLNAQIMEMSGNTLGAETERQNHSLNELLKTKKALQEATGPRSPEAERAHQQELLNIGLKINIIKDQALQTEYNIQAAQEDAKASIYEELGLLKSSYKIRKEIKDLNPAILNMDPELKALQDKLDKLKEIKAAYEEMHSNDDIINRTTQLKNVNDPYATEMEAIRQRYETEQGLIKETLKTKLYSDQETAALTKRLALSEAAQTKEIQNFKISEYKRGAASAADSLSTIGQALMEGNKSQFEQGKAMAIASATISTYLGATQAFTSLSSIPFVGPALGAAAAAAAVLAGIANVSKIESQTYKGGRVSGGAVSSNSQYLVGERGPEIISMGNASGSVTSNSDLALAQQAQLKATKENTKAIARLSEGFNTVIGTFKDQLLQSTNNGLVSNRVAGMGMEKPAKVTILSTVLDAITTHAQSIDKLLISGPWKSLVGLLSFDWKKLGDGLKTLTQGAWDAITLGFGGSLFGGKKSITGQGIVLVYQDKNVGSAQYTDVKTGGGLFAHSKTQTFLSELDARLLDSFRDVADGIETSVNIAGKALGGLTVDLNSVKMAAVKLDLRGMTEEQANKAIEDWFSSLASAMASKLGGAEAQAQLKDATRFGETSYEALMRVTMALQTMNEAALTTGNALQAASIVAGDAASSVIDSFGGMDKFTSAIDRYNKVVSTDDGYNALKLAAAHRTISSALADQNVTIPQTVAEYKTLVQATDMTSPLYKTLIGLSDAFGTIKDAAQTAADGIKSLQDVLLKLKVSDSTLSPEARYNATNTQYARDAALASAGDTEALSRLGSEATDFLNASKDYYASSKGYQDDFASVSAMLERIAITIADQNGLERPTFADPANSFAANPSRTDELISDAQSSEIRRHAVTTQQTVDSTNEEARQTNEELRALIRLQAAANKALIDKLEAMEQRLAGIESTARRSVAA